MRFDGALLALATLLSLTAMAAPARARPLRVGDLPNGDKKTCLNCHTDFKPSAQTDFGSDAQTFLIGTGAVSGKHVSWMPLCPLDSDGDGWTNGRELGDPDCVWKVGDPNPSGTVFNPGDPDSHPPPVCGNGKLDAGEACEGDMLSYSTCAEMGAGDGPLECDEGCGFDYSQCSAPPGGAGAGGDYLPAEEGGCAVVPGALGDGALAIPMIVALAAARALRRELRRKAERRARAM